MFLAGSGVMHTLKGGWVGQTFAIAKCNESDSGGGAASSRKSRIRRSKEERKSMVESFIKKYQTKNNGSFPSLNLTHKEVGGSFYTVREIVREIIQENRVLGPAKFVPGEEAFESNDQFSQDYPLGSIATEPQEVPDSLTIAETHPDLISSLAHVAGGEVVELPEEKQSSHKQLQIVNGNEVDLRSCEPFVTTEAEDVVAGTELVELSEEKQSTDKQLQIVNGSEVDLRSCEPVVTPKTEDVVDELVASTSKVIDMKNIEVETFPLAPISKDAEGVLETSSESDDSGKTLDEQQKADFNLRFACSNPELYRPSSLEKSALESDEAGKNLRKSSLAVAKNAETGNSKAAVLADPPIESSDSSVTKEGTTHGAENGKSLSNKAFFNGASNSKQSKDVKEDNLVQAVKATDGITTENLNGSVPKSEAVNEAKPEAPSSKSVLRESSHNPPLDRINLSESWEASSGTSRRETNPLMAIFKAFVASFVKFWTE